MIITVVAAAVAAFGGLSFGGQSSNIFCRGSSRPIIMFPHREAHGDRAISTGSAVCTLLICLTAMGADFSGRYTSADRSMTVELKAAGNDKYTGTVSSGRQSADLTGGSTATRSPGSLWPAEIRSTSKGC